MELSVKPCTDLKEKSFDAIIVVAESHDKLAGPLSHLAAPLQKLREVDNSHGNIVVLPIDLPAKRLVFSPTAKINPDYHDVRSFAEAAENGIKRALSAGSTAPMLVCVPNSGFKNCELVTLLGALYALYVPLEIRVDVPSRSTKVSKLGVWGVDKDRLDNLIKVAVALESGLFAARDIGGSDPERMAAPRVREYVEKLFAGSCVKISVLSGHDTFLKDYPLIACVDRCANDVDRHRACLIYLTYEGEGPIDKTLMLVGKGVTYDTGGADIKAGGHMASMHRDKCGAAAVAGFFKMLSILKPKGIKVFGGMPMVRNSVGSNAYVADEIITSRCKVRVRIGNTDAEGRMVMGDVLCKFREDAVHEVNPHLMTIATLTGHAVLACGPYTAIMDNGVAKADNRAITIQKAGEAIGDPCEISTLRREDYNFIKGKSEYEDVLQSNDLPSSRTPRGHQFPGAFLVTVSGLDKHGVGSEKPLQYSHVDIAGSSGPFPGIPSGSPILAFAEAYILNRL